ncbi:hypothetical protein F5Y17DRAFT_222083 [Xylariaceae sp. FL0594]|nr:hypothetical protein F5Y17DRAFT_222083 [Xylariaceae sp. FL0594]
MDTTILVIFLLKQQEINLDSRDCFGRTVFSWTNDAAISQALLNTIRKRSIQMDTTIALAKKKVLYDRVGRWCDVCTLGISKAESYYHCKACNVGNFDVCTDCNAVGASCLGDDHELLRELPASN